MPWVEKNRKINNQGGKGGRLFGTREYITKFLFKPPWLTKSMNMDIWVIGILNQLFIRGSYTQIKFSKK